MRLQYTPDFSNKASACGLVPEFYLCSCCVFIGAAVFAGYHFHLKDSESQPGQTRPEKWPCARTLLTNPFARHTLLEAYKELNWLKSRSARVALLEGNCQRHRSAGCLDITQMLASIGGLGVESDTLQPE